MTPPRPISALVCLCLLSIGCGEKEHCDANSDCPTVQRCDTATGLCVARVGTTGDDGGPGGSDADAGPGPSLQSASLPDAVVGNDYQFALTASGGTPPLGFALQNLPAQLTWLSIAPSTGTLSGTPLAVTGAASFEVTVTDALDRTATQTYSLAVRSCIDGETVPCAAEVAGACFLGEQTCTSGALGSCADTVASTRTESCGSGCGACDPTVADTCDGGLCGCGSGGACAGTKNTCCGGSCKDTQTDPEACGDCAGACDTTRSHVVRTCAAGNCEYPCAPGYARCPAGSTAPSCDTDLSTDVANCGGCNQACPTNLPHVTQVGCSQGACGIVQCASGYADCNGNPADGCEANLASDSNHCGACNTACTSQPYTSATACQSAACVVTSCAAGHANCDTQYPNGCEVATSSDINNCGACGTVCSTPANASGVACQSSACVLSGCNGGFANCNGQYGDGCETSLTTIQNCGSCGTVCGGRPNAAGYACSAGNCAVATCSAGFANCNGQYGDGCEVNVTTVQNCGSCGNACGGRPNVAGYVCSGGGCGIGSCAAGWANCNGSYADGCETSISGDEFNCGTCGHLCPYNRPYCSNGICAVSP